MPNIFRYKTFLKIIEENQHSNQNIILSYLQSKFEDILNSFFEIAH